MLWSKCMSDVLQGQHIDRCSSKSLLSHARTLRSSCQQGLVGHMLDGVIEVEVGGPELWFLARLKINGVTWSLRGPGVRIDEALPVPMFYTDHLWEREKHQGLLPQHPSVQAFLHAERNLIVVVMQRADFASPTLPGSVCICAFTQNILR